MRWMVLISSLAMATVVGCSSSHETSVLDSGPIIYDVGPASDGARGPSCGPVTCAVGLDCCNASCGICTAPGVGCVDIACADAGPSPRLCGGLAGLTCDVTEYCDYPDGSFCGGDDSQGICRTRPTACTEPGGNAVCGCDGHDYLGDCSVYLAGTDIAHQGACSTPPPAHSISATSSCGPTDGPAWTFQITDGGPVCTVPTTASLSISVWDVLEGVAAGTVFTIGSVVTSQGQATYCPAGGGGPPCFTLNGTVTFDSFIGHEAASFSYDLTASDGSRYAGSHVSVGPWCSDTPLCG